MSELKYIIVSGEHFGTPWEFPVVFDRKLVHSDMARCVIRAQSRENGTVLYNVVAAGFYDSETGRTHGYSESLRVGGRPEDAAVIARGGQRVAERETAPADRAAKPIPTAMVNARPTPPATTSKSAALRDRFKRR